MASARTILGLNGGLIFRSSKSFHFMSLKNKWCWMASSPPWAKTHPNRLETLFCINWKKKYTKISKWILPFSTPLCSRNFQNVNLKSTLQEFIAHSILHENNFDKISISKIAIFTIIETQLWILVHFGLEKWLKSTKIKIQNL